MAFIRASSCCAIVLAACAGGILFWVSQKVQDAERQKAAIEESLEHEQEALRVLKAEWDYLNRPDRLEAMAKKYLNMVPASSDTLLRPDDKIPEPVEMLSDETPIFIGTSQEKPESKKKSIPTEAASPTLQSAEPAREDSFEKVLNGVAKGGVN